MLTFSLKHITYNETIIILLSHLFNPLRPVAISKQLLLAAGMDRYFRLYPRLINRDRSPLDVNQTTGSGGHLNM